jgi:hypothetical protein
MITVEVPVPADVVRTSLRDMRQWLDDVRFGPSRVVWRAVGGHFVVRARFKVAWEAAAFAQHFGGRVL